MLPKIKIMLSGAAALAAVGLLILADMLSAVPPIIAAIVFACVLVITLIIVKE